MGRAELSSRRSGRRRLLRTFRTRTGSRDRATPGDSRSTAARRRATAHQGGQGMSAIDVAAIVAIVLCLATAAVFALMIWRMVRAVRQLDALAESLRVETVPLVSDLRATVRQAGDDLDRVEAVLGKAETIATTVDAA